MNWKRKLLVIGICALVAANALSADYYVNATATGANNGGSGNDAWQSLASISQGSLSAGDRVFIDYAGGADYGSVAITQSGSAANNAGRITFVGTGASQPVLSGTITSNGADYFAFINFEFAGSGQGTAFNLNNGVVGCLFQDIYVHAKTTAFAFDRNANNQYNIVRGCTTDNMWAADGSGEYQNELGGSYNVFEYCVMNDGGDRLTNFSHHLIYRNNFFGPMATGDLDGADPHTDDLQTWAGGPHTLWNDKCLVEAIFTRELTTGDGHMFSLRDESNLGLQGLIMRGIVAGGMRTAGRMESFEDVWVYNVTFLDFLTSNNYCANLDNGSSGTWINSSFTRTNNNSSISPVYPNGGASFTLANNHEYLSGNLTGTANQENVDPGFVSEDLDTVGYAVPDAGSVLLNNQRYMTLANGAGSDTTALVADEADWFIDGWGLVEGDLIKIGSGDWVRISAIDYGTEAITLAEARTWLDNDEIYLYGMEQIGALPFGHSDAVSGVLTLGSPNVVVVTGEARMVIFYEDGVPQAPDYDTPYTYTDNGGVVTAKVYKRFASQTPVIQAVDSGVTIPTAPSALGESATTSTSITMGWTDNSADEDGFYLYRSTAVDGVYIQIADLAANTVSFQDTGLASGTTYYYHVTAYNAAGESGNVADDATTASAVDAPPRIGPKSPVGASAIQIF